MNPSPKKTVHNVFTITTKYTRRCSVKVWKFHGKKCPLKLLNKFLKKYLGKSSLFLVNLQVLKMNSFTRSFQGFY